MLSNYNNKLPNMYNMFLRWYYSFLAAAVNQTRYTPLYPENEKEHFTYFSTILFVFFFIKNILTIYVYINVFIHVDFMEFE